MPPIPSLHSFAIAISACLLAATTADAAHRAAGQGRHWDITPQQLERLEGLLKKFGNPVVDDEPTRNGTPKFNVAFDGEVGARHPKRTGVSAKFDSVKTDRMLCHV